MMRRTRPTLGANRDETAVKDEKEEGQ